MPLLSPDLLVLLDGLDILVAFERVDLVLGELHTTGRPKVLDSVVFG